MSDLILKDTALINVISGKPLKVIAHLLHHIGTKQHTSIWHNYECGHHVSDYAAICQDFYEDIQALVDIQAYVSTQSYEFVKAMYDVCGDDMRYYRIELQPETGDPLVVAYTPKTLAAALELAYEIRG